MPGWLATPIFPLRAALLGARRRARGTPARARRWRSTATSCSRSCAAWTPPAPPARAWPSQASRPCCASRCPPCTAGPAPPTARRASSGICHCLPACRSSAPSHLPADHVSRVLQSVADRRSSARCRVPGAPALRRGRGRPQVADAQRAGAPDANGAISIREPGADAGAGAEPMSARTQADADYARQLQAKMDAAEARGGPRRARSSTLTLCMMGEGDRFAASVRLCARVCRRRQLGVHSPCLRMPPGSPEARTGAQAWREEGPGLPQD